MEANLQTDDTSIRYASSKPTAVAKIVFHTVLDLD
jgi:hypothetical protein